MSSLRMTKYRLRMTRGLLFRAIRNPRKIIFLWGLKKVRFCVHFIKLIYLFLKIVYAIIATRVEVFWFLFTWWRSGNNGNYNNAYVMAPSGVNDNNHNVTNAYGVRPALHSLTKWCKFSCIWQIAGKKLLRFANWLIWVWRGLLSCLLFFYKRRNKLDLSATDFLLWNVLEKVVELFFIATFAHYDLWANFLVRKLARVQSIRFLRPNAKSHFLMPHKKAILWGPHFVQGLIYLTQHA